MCLGTFTSSRVAGDSDFTEGKRLSWTWTDQNSSFTTIPIILNFHGSLLQYLSFVLVPWHWKEGSWYQRHGRWGGHSSTSHTFARLLLPLQGSDISATCPFSRGRQVTNPLKTPDSSLTQFSTSDKGREPPCFHLPCLWWRLPCLSLSPQQENTTFPNSGNDRLQNVHSAHSAIYLDLHICIMVLLLSGKDSDCPDQSIHKGEENFLLAL